MGAQGNGQNTLDSNMDGQGLPTSMSGGYQSLDHNTSHTSRRISSSHDSFCIPSDSTQMQTPPPTRDTSAKKLPRGPHVAFGTPSTIASRRMTTPRQDQYTQQNSQVMQQTNMNFPYLQFSPEALQFGNTGAVTAPVHLQNQDMWAQTPQSGAYPHSAMLADPFVPNASGQMMWPSMHGQSSVQNVAFDTPTMTEFPSLTPQPGLGPAIPLVPSSRAAQASATTTAGVDPSLLYSSPVRTEQDSNFSPTDARLRMLSMDTAFDQQNRLDAYPYMDLTHNVPKPSLRRNHTTGATRPSSMHFPVGGAAETLVRSNSSLQPPRTTSPLKRTAKPLGSISEAKKLRPRASMVVLTTDKSGLARIETRALPPDNTPARSAREKYPGLFDSDSSEGESDAEEEARSRQASFSFSRSDIRRSKVPRLNTPPDDIDGLSIPRSSSSASSRVSPSRAAIAAAAQLRRYGSLKKRPSNRSLPRRAASFVSDVSPIENVPVLPQPAAENKPVVSRSFSAAVNGLSLEDHNRRWNNMSFGQRQSSQSISPKHTQAEFAVQDVRPLRCLCGVTSGALPDVPMIQCASCTHWSHEGCVGLASKTLQPFTCGACNRVSRSMRMAAMPVAV